VRPVAMLDSQLQRMGGVTLHIYDRVRLNVGRATCGPFLNPKSSFEFQKKCKKILDIDND
jgi:hypothetical protein